MASERTRGGAPALPSASGLGIEVLQQTSGLSNLNLAEATFPEIRGEPAVAGDVLRWMRKEIERLFSGSGPMAGGLVRPEDLGPSTIEALTGTITYA